MGVSNLFKFLAEVATKHFPFLLVSLCVQNT